MSLALGAPTMTYGAPVTSSFLGASAPITMAAPTMTYSMPTAPLTTSMPLTTSIASAPLMSTAPVMSSYPAAPLTTSMTSYAAPTSTFGPPMTASTTTDPMPVPMVDD